MMKFKCFYIFLVLCGSIIFSGETLSKNSLIDVEGFGCYFQLPPDYDVKFRFDLNERPIQISIIPEDVLKQNGSIVIRQTADYSVLKKSWKFYVEKIDGGMEIVKLENNDPDKFTRVSEFYFLVNGDVTIEFVGGENSSLRFIDFVNFCLNNPKD